MTPTWHPTDTLLRAALASLAFVIVAVLTGRPDVLVLVVPLLVWTAAAVVRHPTTVPRATARLLHSPVREGEGTVVRTSVEQVGDAEHVVVGLSAHRWVSLSPAYGVVGRTLSPAGTVGDTGVARLDVVVASRRWGRRAVGDGVVAATSPWAGYRCGPARLLPLSLLTLPLPGRFDARAPAPHPVGLVGTHPARRAGEGSEFSSIRPFLPGDRLRRVHWRVSLRTGRLHVTSTVAEEDSAIMLLVDAGVEIGAGGGLGEPASTLDIAVRAAGAIAEHYLHRGDRIGLRVLGATTHNSVYVGAGRRHFRRTLDTLARIAPGEKAGIVDPSRMQFGISRGTVVVVLSPMLSDHAVSVTTTLARRGLSVVVVDTVPSDLHLGVGGDADERRHEIAWRMRLLERDIVLGKVRASGIPVVPWRGPGTLDEVLGKLGRRAAQPRLVRR